MQNQTGQQKRAALRDDGPWRNLPVSPSARDLNRRRYEAKKRAKAEAAAKAASQIVPTIDTDHKNYQGLPMPAWSDLPPKIQDAWRAAARKCHDTVAAWVKATTPPSVSPAAAGIGA